MSFSRLRDSAFALTLAENLKPGARPGVSRLHVCSFGLLSELAAF